MTRSGAPSRTERVRHRRIVAAIEHVGSFKSLGTEVGAREGLVGIKRIKPWMWYSVVCSRLKATLSRTKSKRTITENAAPSNINKSVVSQKPDETNDL